MNASTPLPGNSPPEGEYEDLLGLWSDPGRSSAEVKRLAQAHADELAARIAEMQAMQRTLQTLAAHCHGDARPECPILDDLAGPAPEGARPDRRATD